MCLFHAILMPLNDYGNSDDIATIVVDMWGVLPDAELRRVAE
jgi:hypothetical protein